ncbi:hypothetical protein [Jannaschia sp. CCS1]|uniref:hypothetical protein n=1 Tax=Jannaschia sp. (strain CCS1) TaxID=290400 RepID=UPI000053CFAA|nr:hypothetical protein [Jannaschia sp. CCS1]ABD53033.1 hypothetical protein Jann_0116 [Jannaschia sp. CCS1]
MTRLIALPLLALALPAQAELPPCVSDDLMRQASLVVQITDPSVETFANNICRISGTIVQVHRGAANVGQSLTATFDCLIDPSQAVIGGTVYSDPDALARAGAVEVHIGSDGYVAANGAGLIALNAPTQRIAWEPYCS